MQTYTVDILSTGVKLTLSADALNKIKTMISVFGPESLLITVSQLLKKFNNMEADPEPERSIVDNVIHVPREMWTNKL